MAFRPKKKQPDFTRISTILAQIKEKDNALYQTLKELIDRLRQFQLVINETIEEIFALIETLTNAINNITNIINALKLKTYLTTGDETADLPNSVQLLAGPGIVFDDSVANKRTISIDIDVNDLFTGIIIKTAEIEIPFNRRNGKVLIKGDFEDKHVGAPVIVSQAPDNESDMVFVQFVGEVINNRQLRVYWMAPFGAPRKIKINYMIGA